MYRYIIGRCEYDEQHRDPLNKMSAAIITKAVVDEKITEECS